MTGRTILIVEDEVGLAELLRDYLHASGFATEMLHEGTGVVERVRAAPPSLILLDLMLPGRDGLEICRELRTFTNVPIIMVTAKVEEIDRLLGLELGADDYVCKPFSPREVVGRVKAVLRRTEPGQRLPLNGGLHIDVERFEATLDSRRLDLTPVEFRMLALLSEQQGRVFSRAILIDRIYDDNRVVTDRTVDTHIKNLRRKLQQAGAGGEVIHSVYGVGYKLEWETA